MSSSCPIQTSRYELTPVFHGIEPNWIKYYEAYSTLGLQCKQVADLVGVSPVFLSKSSANPPGYQSTDHSAALHRRFYAALILYDLVNEVPFWKLEEKYDVSRGGLQQLQTSSFTFAGMVHAFVNKLVGDSYFVPNFLGLVGHGSSDRSFYGQTKFWCSDGIATSHADTEHQR